MNALGLSNINLYNSISLSGKYGAYTAQKITPPERNNIAIDKVTISEQGKSLSNQKVPEELLRMAMAPGWYSDYAPAPNKVGTPESYEVGHGARMDKYKETFKAELAEYGKLFNEAFESSKKELGINTQNDMYEKIIKNPENSEALRQAFEKRIIGSPNGIELMNILGIKRK